MRTPAAGPASDPPDTSRHRALAAASRVRMLHLVRRAEAGMTAAEVAAATGLHPSTVRAHLDQLTASGLLTRHRQPDGSPGRPAWCYRAATPSEPETAAGGGPAGRAYRGLAAALIAHLARSETDPHSAGVRAGRDWGRALAAPLNHAGGLAGDGGADRLGRTAPLDGLLQVLEQLGFTPRLAGRDGAQSAEVHLRSCPFLELAEASPDVVCGVHLGVIGGILGALGLAGVDPDLRPFALPGACVVHLRPRAAGPADPDRPPAAGPHQEPTTAPPA